MPDKMPYISYIWDINNPNEPEYCINQPSPLCSIVFNHKNPDTLAGGSYNGLVCFYDLRTNPNKVKNMSNVEKSHQDPV